MNGCGGELKNHLNHSTMANASEKDIKTIYFVSHQLACRFLLEETALVISRVSFSVENVSLPFFDERSPSFAPGMRINTSGWNADVDILICSAQTGSMMSF
jgi:hypothetical protein